MDNYEDACEYYDTRYDEILIEIVKEVRGYKKGFRQYWKAISITRIKKIWADYMRMGIVRDEEGVDEVARDIIDKIITIDVNTMLLGHGEEDPADALDAIGVKYTEKNLEDLAYYLTDDAGVWRISDYALKKLKASAMELLMDQTAEEKVLRIDRILNIVHQRSDLAAWFIQGGRAALDDLGGKS